MGVVVGDVKEEGRKDEKRKGRSLLSHPRGQVTFWGGISVGMSQYKW